MMLPRTPLFFVSVASKGFKHCASPLFATHTKGHGSVASKGLIVHQNCAYFARVTRGRWAQARTGICCNCTQKLLYQRDMGSSRRIAKYGPLNDRSLKQPGTSIRPSFHSQCELKGLELERLPRGRQRC